jgi:hypothetical protein
MTDLTNLLRRFLWWFYAELPAYYAIPIVGLVFVLIVGVFQ